MKVGATKSRLLRKIKQRYDKNKGYQEKLKIGTTKIKEKIKQRHGKIEVV